MQTPATPIQEARRLKSLHALGILDTVPDAAFDRVTQIAAAAFNVPIALVSLVDRNRQWFKSRQGLDATETPRDISFCGHAILGDETFVIRDAANDIRFHDNPLVLGEPGIRFYAGQPLHAPDGQRVGTLCLVDRRPREFSTRDQKMLVELAGQVEQELARLAVSVTDPVTQLANRQGFDARVRLALSNCRRAGSAGCFGVIRLDGASDLDIRLGDAAAHAVLRQFSDVFAAVFGGSDILAHGSPGEFRFFAPGRSEAEILELLDQLAQQSCGSVGGRSYLDPIWFAGTADIPELPEAGPTEFCKLCIERLEFFQDLHGSLQQAFSIS